MLFLGGEEEGVALGTLVGWGGAGGEGGTVLGVVGWGWGFFHYFVDYVFF